MPWESPTKVLSFPAAGDLSANQFWAVALGTDGRVNTISATTTKPLGVLQDTPSAAGEMCSVCVSGVSSMMVYNGTLALNDSIGVQADGYGIPTTTDNRWVVGDLLDIGGSGTDAGINILTSVLVNVHRY